MTSGDVGAQPPFVWVEHVEQPHRTIGLGSEHCSYRPGLHWRGKEVALTDAASQFLETP